MFLSERCGILVYVLHINILWLWSGIHVHICVYMGVDKYAQKIWWEKVVKNLWIV